MVIHPSKSDISVRFSLDKNKFSVDAVDLKFSEIENLILMKNQTTEFTVNISPLIVTQILSKKNISYSEIMLRLLPTIQVIYAEPMPNTRVASEKIENVIVKK